VVVASTAYGALEVEVVKGNLEGGTDSEIELRGDWLTV